MAQTPNQIAAYFDVVGGLGHRIEATDATGAGLAVEKALDWALARARQAHDAGRKIIFVGNGGSASIASHMAIDYSKNAGLRAIAFNDAAALTCLGNDVGYDNVFGKQVELYGAAGDLLIAISSSGNSANIVNAALAARRGGIGVLTLSGFKPDNRLRKLGDVNFYVPNNLYGFVELSHLAICHAILDIASGWQADGVMPRYMTA